MVGVVGVGVERLSFRFLSRMECFCFFFFFGGGGDRDFIFFFFKGKM